MTKAKRTAIKLRWFLLGMWVLCIVAGIIWIFSIFYSNYAALLGAPVVFILGPFNGLLGNISDNWQYCAVALIYIGLFFFTQWLFLAPRKLWKIKTRTSARPMKKAAIAAAFAAALLSAGLIYSILDFFSVTISELPLDVPSYLFVSIPLILWIFWSVVFCVYFRQTDHYTWAGKIIRALIAGSILELFVSIPVFITREEDCYCARSSYAGIIFGATVLLWAFGPAVFLLFLKQKHQIEKLDT